MSTLPKAAPVEVTTASNYRWAMLAVYYLGAIAFGVVFQSIPPLLPLMIQDLHLSYAQAGSLQSLFALPGFALAIPVGLMVDRRFGGRKVVIACYVAMIVGTLIVTTASSYPMLLVGRLIAGAGGISLNVVLARLVTHWFAGKELGIAIGLYSTGVPVATMLSLSLLGDFAQRSGWQAAAFIGVVATVVPLVALLLFYRQSPVGRAVAIQDRKQEATWRKIVTIGLPAWMVGLTWLWFNAATISFVTFGPDYFNTRGFGLGFAGFLTSIQMLSAPILAPIVGLTMDRYRQPELAAGAGALAIGLAITLLPTFPSLILPLMLLLSLGVSFTPPAVVYLAGKSAPSRDSGLAFGIISTCLTVGIVVGPYLVGVARDMSGSYEMGFMLIAVFAALSAATAGALKIIRTRSLEG